MSQTFETHSALPQGYEQQPSSFDTQGGSGVEGEHKPTEKSVKSAYTDLKYAFDYYKDFQENWGKDANLNLPEEKWINRPGQYPDSHIMGISLLAALVLVEGLANAQFFSKASDLGLLGGWIQAIMVAFTNVLASFFLVGFLGVRTLMNPHQKLWFVCGLVGTPIAMGAILMLNFTAAQYRDLLELSSASLAQGDSAVTGHVMNPVTNALSFTQLQTLEALLLLILGLTFACIAAYKGATWEDRILGYGAVQKKLDIAADKLNKAIEGTKKVVPSHILALLHTVEAYPEEMERRRKLRRLKANGTPSGGADEKKPPYPKG
ncbi:hypothetical protein [Woodsholea maritima]|uniref:hypothetical protein n=1 Tax=Woodsholea maritima TaxID=240237 RepID=UPI00036565B1|nr:hypothetical protein [Woodsholea maritima]